MGSPEAATVKETTRQARRDCVLSLREERPLQYIGTDTGADGKETHVIKAIIARNEGLETPVLNTDVSARIHSH
jgi:hypothetical protein